MVSNLALFCAATCLATFQKIGRFFPNHLVTLNVIHNFQISNEILLEKIRIRKVVITF